MGMIISGMWSVTKYSISTAILLAVAAAVTKPTDKSLDEASSRYISASVKTGIKSKDDGFLAGTMKNMIGNVVPMVFSAPIIHDLGVFKLASVNPISSNEGLKFVGAFNTWICVNDDRSR